MDISLFYHSHLSHTIISQLIFSFYKKNTLIHKKNEFSSIFYFPTPIIHFHHRVTNSPPPQQQKISHGKIKEIATSLAAIAFSGHHIAL